MLGVSTDFNLKIYKIDCRYAMRTPENATNQYIYSES